MRQVSSTVDALADKYNYFKDNIPIIFKDPPPIPTTLGLDDITIYKIIAKEYNNRISLIGTIFFQLLASLLIVGLLWITVDWVRWAVTTISILLGIILIMILYRLV